MSGEAPTPGWYPDPAGGGARWWDGRRWTSETRTSPHSAAASRGKGLIGRYRVLVIASVIVALALAGIGVAFTMMSPDPTDTSGTSPPGSPPTGTNPSDRSDDAEIVGQAPQAAGYAEMARQLRLGKDETGNLIWAANYDELERLGIIDRSAGTEKGQAYPEAIAALLQRYPHHTSLPRLWNVVRANSFSWPDTEPALGFSLMGTDVAVWSGTSSAFRLHDTEDVTSFLSQEANWDSSLSTDNTWTWTGARGLPDTDDIADQELAEQLAQDSSGTPYQLQVVDEIVLLAQSVEDTKKPYPADIELLEYLRSAPLALVFDARETLQRNDREEPPGGYLDRIRAAGLTMSWTDGDPVEQLHLLMMDSSAARAATTQLRTTIDRDEDLAETLGRGASVENDGKMVTLTMGESTVTLSRIIHGHEDESGPKSALLDAFAME